jgi:hypothetical protein
MCLHMFGCSDPRVRARWVLKPEHVQYSTARRDGASGPDHRSPPVPNQFGSGTELKDDEAPSVPNQRGGRNGLNPPVIGGGRVPPRSPCRISFQRLKHHQLNSISSIGACAVPAHDLHTVVSVALRYWLQVYRAAIGQTLANSIRIHLGKRYVF